MSEMEKGISSTERYLVLFALQKLQEDYATACLFNFWSIFKKEYKFLIIANIWLSGCYNTHQKKIKIPIQITF